MRKYISYTAIYVLFVVLCFMGIRGYITHRINSTDNYTGFSAEILDSSKDKCEVNRGINTEEVDCYKIKFQDPTNKQEHTLEITSETYQIGEGTSLTKGQFIQINKIKEPIDGPAYVFNGYDRTLSYFWMFVFFIALVIVVAGKRGARSILSLAISVLIIWKAIIPLILNGNDPILIAAGIGFLMFSLQIYLTNGLNKQSTISILGSAVGVIATIILAQVFSNMTNISGFGDESSGYLSLNSPNAISIRNLVVGSFILGVFGVVDDATVSQVSVVGELLQARTTHDKLELFKSAMRVGSSHIGSLMNTLFIAYVASALPLITLLFIYNPNLYEIVNLDLFTEEIVRTIVGSMGLVISIPATTYFAVSMLKKEDEVHGHHH